MLHFQLLIKSWTHIGGIFVVVNGTKWGVEVWAAVRDGGVGQSAGVARGAPCPFAWTPIPSHVVHNHIRKHSVTDYKEIL